MQIDRFDYFVWAIIAALMLAILGLIWGSSLIGIEINRTIPQEGGEVGMSGPIGIEFAQAMNQKSVEEHFSLLNGSPGTFRWDENMMMFYPQGTLEAGERYTATLLPGSLGEDNRKVKEEISWSFTVRDPWIVYLSYGDPGRDIFKLSMSGGEIEQLTTTNGKVYDFSPSSDGEKIAYSLINEEEGIDIWVMLRDGNNSKKIIDCQNHRCSSPRWSPDSTQIAYIKSEAGLGPDEPYSAPRVWLFDVRSGTSTRLYSDNQKIGYSPSWSPDGRKLTYVDGINNLLVAVDLESRHEIKLPNQLGSIGSWSPDSKKLLFGDISSGIDSYSEIIYEVDMTTQDVIVLYGNLPNDNQYYHPQWSPDGKWITVSVRPSGSNINRSLAIFPVGDVIGTTIADNPNYVYLNYQFDPSGRYLVYQRHELGKAYTQPEILLYDTSSDSSIVLAGNASFPSWLP
ncbi:MAG: hypothetical protein PVF83_00525 [Anaerolineales bacterium]|jgi:Tol biopolymer transport system component